MRYVTTNIRLPEDLWKTFKLEAAHRGKRFSEIVRERLRLSLTFAKGSVKRKPKSLLGIWKGAPIPDSALEEAKRSLFPPPERFLGP